jgi:hypothetical protein
MCKKSCLANYIALPPITTPAMKDSLQQVAQAEEKVSEEPLSWSTYLSTKAASLFRVAPADTEQDESSPMPFHERSAVLIAVPAFGALALIAVVVRVQYRKRSAVTQKLTEPLIKSAYSPWGPNAEGMEDSYALWEKPSDKPSPDKTSI